MHVIIIGGGSAGIAAAYTILEASGGHTVEMFEADAKLGGRARTSQGIPGFAFDMGAQYVQDPSENPWVAIAKELGFTLIEEKADYKLRIDTGTGWRDENTTFPPVQDVVTTIDASFEVAKTRPNVVVARKPRFGTQAEVFGYATSQYGSFSESAETWQYLASDRARQKVVKEESNFFVKEGLGTLVRTYGDQLKTKFKDRFTLRVGTPARLVEHNAKGVTVTAADGRTPHPADACIVTAPVSVLADGIIRFSPALPSAHQVALRVLRLGSYKKLAIQMRSEPTAIEVGCNYYLFQDQPEGIWQYYRLAASPSVLVAHAAGDFALALDRMGDSEVFGLFTAALEEAYPDERLGFTAKRAMTNWTDDGNVRGAYSYTAFAGGGPDDPAALQGRPRLAEPVGRVHIAGEATSTDFYGTITGAYQEGVRAARAVLHG